MNHAAALFSQQPSRERQRPTRIDNVVDQQDGARGYLLNCAERAGYVACLHRTVGHQLLLRRLRGANQRRHEWNAKRSRQSRGEIIHQPRMASRGNGCYPLRKWVRIPPLANQHKRVPRRLSTWSWLASTKAAAQRRQSLAQGVSPGSEYKTVQAPEGRQPDPVPQILSPLPGLARSLAR